MKSYIALTILAKNKKAQVNQVWQNLDKYYLYQAHYTIPLVLCVFDNFHHHRYHH